MIEEPAIMQMNIDRYRTMLKLRMTGEQRTRIEQLLQEALRQLDDAIGLLATAIDPTH